MERHQSDLLEMVGKVTSDQAIHVPTAGDDA